MISIENLKFTHKQSNFELYIEKLNINKSEKVIFTGPSGCGKTTLLNLIAGIILPLNGSISYEANQLNTLSDKKRRDFRIHKIGFVFQTFELIDYLSVLDNITLPFRISKTLKLTKDIIDKAKNMANQVGLDNKIFLPITSLSHGEKQRVAICRAMINNPEYIIADEPTGNLDENNKKYAMDLLLTQATKSNATLIMVTHDLSLIRHFDRNIDFASLITTPLKENFKVNQSGLK